MAVESQKTTGSPRKILIIDDHPVVRRGLSAFLAKSQDRVVCAEAGGIQEALRAIREDPPDLVLSDLELGDGSGLDLIATMKGEFPEIPVIIVSMHAEEIYAERVIRAGGKGYLMKDGDPDKMMEAIRAAMSGEIAISGRMKDKILLSLSNRRRSASGNLDDLTDRELQIFRMAGVGLPARIMAEKLSLSSKTIEAHLAHIRRKLAVDSGMELRRLAYSTFSQGNGAVKPAGPDPRRIPS